jgi:ATP-dependent DNA helicase RecG
VHDLLRQGEGETVEFKHDNVDPVRIGQDVSALANAASLARRRCGYVIWGIDDAARSVVGTRFSPSRTTVGNQPLELWLAQLVNPPPALRFDERNVDGHRVVVLTVPAAHAYPVRFRSEAYVRIGSATTKLAYYPEHERRLWRFLDRMPLRVPSTVRHSI